MTPWCHQGKKCLHRRFVEEFNRGKQKTKAKTSNEAWSSRFPSLSRASINPFPDSYSEHKPQLKVMSRQNISIKILHLYHAYLHQQFTFWRDNPHVQASKQSTKKQAVSSSTYWQICGGNIIKKGICEGYLFPPFLVAFLFSNTNLSTDTGSKHSCSLQRNS